MATFTTIEVHGVGIAPAGGGPSGGLVALFVYVTDKNAGLGIDKLTKGDFKVLAGVNKVSWNEQKIKSCDKTSTLGLYVLQMDDLFDVGSYVFEVTLVDFVTPTTGFVGTGFGTIVVAFSAN